MRGGFANFVERVDFCGVVDSLKEEIFFLSPNLARRSATGEIT